MLDKSNHLVTVSREYLEKLEKVAESEFNMRGDVRILNVSGSFNKPFAHQAPTLFITDNNLRIDGIIIVDEEGRERGKFIREDAIRI